MLDFHAIHSRRQTNSVKWQVAANELPLSLADMEFATAPEIIAALQAKVQQGIFGYENVPPAYYAAVQQWYSQEHQSNLLQDWMVFCVGVIPALSSIVRSLSNVGDNVVVQAPVYDIFYHSIENNGRHVLTNDLQYDSDQQHYTVNWVDLEQKLANPLTKLMILCNPHNPIGKVWSKAELKRLLQLGQQNHVVIVSDEIHGDLVLGSPTYTPLFAVATADNFDQIVVLTSPSKTFNLAALHAATVIIPNAYLQQIVSRGLNNDELTEPNLVAIPGSIAAYTQGSQWLQQLKQQLQQNRDLVQKYLTANLPQVQLVSENATYLLWLDVHQVTATATSLVQYLRRQTGLIVNDGTVYRGNGAHFIRLNSACPPALLTAGLERLSQGTQAFLKEQ